MGVDLVTMGCMGPDIVVHGRYVFSNYTPIQGVKVPYGARVITGSGYVRLKLWPEDEFYSQAYKGGWVTEHQYVMALKIGYIPKKPKTVHHKNGIRDDNRFENLELWEHGQRISKQAHCPTCTCR